MTTTDPAPAADPQDPATADPQGDPADLGDAGRRAIAAERAAAAEAIRQLREAQTQLAGMQGRITELETTNGTLTSQLTDTSRDATRYRIALEQGLPPALAGRLQGADEAAMVADAEALLALIPAQPTSRTPRPDPSQGSRTPAPTSPEAAFQAWAQSTMN
jgi:TolA-binding protein